MKESNEQEVLITESSSMSIPIKGKRKEVVKGWIAFNMSKENWAKYIGHNVKVRVEVVEDLGLDERYQKRKK